MIQKADAGRHRDRLRISSARSTVEIQGQFYLGFACLARYSRCSGRHLETMAWGGREMMT
jgi:hypothetical protein